MAFDVEAAKKEGYTDEEIAAYLRGQSGTPIPVQEQPSRAAEVAATVAPTVANYIPEAVGVAAAGYGLKKYGPDIVRNAGNIVNKMTSGGAVPTSTYGMPGGTPIGSPVSGPVAPTPMAAPQPAAASPSMTQQVQRLAFEKLAPAARAMAPAAIGLSGLTYSSGLNQGEEEELRRRRMMAPTISRGQ
jgi:hypothetical protein